MLRLVPPKPSHRAAYCNGSLRACGVAGEALMEVSAAALFDHEVNHDAWKGAVQGAVAGVTGGATSSRDLGARNSSADALDGAPANASQEHVAAAVGLANSARRYRGPRPR